MFLHNHIVFKTMLHIGCWIIGYVKSVEKFQHFICVTCFCPWRDFHDKQNITTSPSLHWWQFCTYFIQGDLLYRGKSMKFVWLRSFFCVTLILPGKSPISIAICFFSPAQISQLDFTEGIQSETANSQTVSPFLVLSAIPQSSHLQKVYINVYFLLQSVLFL